jgi:DNA-binding transcriptional regulator YiaG
MNTTKMANRNPGTQEEEVEIMNEETDTAVETIKNIVQKAKGKGVPTKTPTVKAFQMQELSPEQKFTCSPIEKGKKAIKDLVAKQEQKKTVPVAKKTKLPVIKTFSEFMFQLRVTLDMQQTEIAPILGMKQNTISKWENSDTKPRRLVVQRIEGLLKEKKLTAWIPVLYKVL